MAPKSMKSTMKAIKASPNKPVGAMNVTNVSPTENVAAMNAIDVSPRKPVQTMEAMTVNKMLQAMTVPTNTDVVVCLRTHIERMLIKQLFDWYFVRLDQCRVSQQCEVS